MGDVKNHTSAKNEQTKKSGMRIPSTGDNNFGNDDTKISSGSSGSTVALSTSGKNGPVDSNTDIERRTRRSRHSTTIKSVNLKLNTDLATKKDSAKPESPNAPTAYLNSVMNTLVSENASSPAPDKLTSGNGQTSNGSSLNIFKSSQKRKNRNQEIGSHHKPAEVFRKDLISAMKIPDTSQLLSEEYWVMKDSWRMEWEKGVQVPVNAEGLPGIKVDTVPKDIRGDFRMPRKFIKTTPDVGDRDTVNLNVLADSTCRYDLDEVDVSWLQVINEERECLGSTALDEFTMEIIMEELETQCHENMQLAIKTKEGLGIEYDENIVCDVCRSPDCEEGNEMVFCDGCNLCVHQACYGILKVPEGSWLCKPCALGIRGSAVCILCGKKGGAMKSTKSGRKWAHMSCALWIPEINIADPDRMEPITKVSHIPSSRWALVCTVCKERNIGACIQCSVRHCVTAYHVTCAMENGFDMITDCLSPNSPLSTGESSIVFRSFCQKHSRNSKKKLENSPGKKTEEEKRSDRQKRIAELEEDFYTLVKSDGVASALNISPDTATEVLEYWKLKRKANFNRPLLTPKQEEGKALAEAAETGLQRRLRMFTHLRQDLERVRNLCYMIGKREKMKRSSVKLMSNVFLAQIHYVEYRMSQSSNFDPKILLSSLPTCGNKQILDQAKKETMELLMTPEWSQRDESRSNSPSNIEYVNTSKKKDEKVVASKNDDAESDVSDRPRPLPKSSATVTQITSPRDKPSNSKMENKSSNSQKQGDTRKNGLVADIKVEYRKGSNEGVPFRDDALKQKILDDNDLKKHSKKMTLETKSEVSKTFDPKSNKNLRGSSQESESRRRSHSNLRGREKSDSKNDFTKKVQEKSNSDNKVRHKYSSEKRFESKKHRTTSSSDGRIDTVKYNEKSGKINEEIRTSRARLKHAQLESPDISAPNSPNVQSSTISKDVSENRRSADETKDMIDNPSLINKKRKMSSTTADNERSTTERGDKNSRKMLRRSSRNLDFSNSEDSDIDSLRFLKRGMTIMTETISETKRISVEEDSWDGKSQRKRTWSGSGDQPPSPSKSKKRRKESTQSVKDLKQSSTKRPTSPMQQNSSEDFTDGESAQSRASSQNKGRTRKPTSGSFSPFIKERRRSSANENLSPVVKKPLSKHQQAKNGQRALAPSPHDRIIADGESPHLGDIPQVRRTSGQELDDSFLSFSPKTKNSPRSESLSNSDSNDAFVSSKTNKKLPTFDIGDSNSSWKTPGLDISYGSNCPAPLRAQRSEKQTASSGLRWVPLISEDTLSYPPSSITPKDQDGYRGDMDESDSDFQNVSSRHHHKHHRKLSKSRKKNALNPGKHRTGIGILQAKPSDSSEEDFDLSFSMHPSSSEKSRQKLRSISNTSPASSNSPLHTHINVTEPKEHKTDTDFKEPINKPSGPKNVRAVGGILGGLKCEPDVSIPPFYSNTTDGNKSHDNFFEKFSFLNESRDESPPYSHKVHDNIPLLQNRFPPPEMMSFRAEPFQSHSIFPYGSIGSWQMPHHTSALPSILPNRFAMPVYYQYPPPPPYRKDRPSGAFISNEERHHPSPPPMPDSTLSPESFLPSSASVAVQAQAESLKVPDMLDETNLTQKLSKKISHSIDVPDEGDNEWEVVAGSGNEVQLETNSDDERRRRRRKKKKKKKKRRRLRFPDGYDSEKRGISSPSSVLPEPIHGAIVPRGQSTNYKADSPMTSESSSRNELFKKSPMRLAESQNYLNRAEQNFASNKESDFDRKNSEIRPGKLVLKINKNKLIVPKANYDSDDSSMSSQSSSPESNFPIKSSPNQFEDTVTSGSGLKLKIKKSLLQFNPNKHFSKNYKKHKHRSHDRLKMPSSRQSSNLVLERPNLVKKHAALRRLGLNIDNMPKSESPEEGIGRKALRERKPMKTDDGPEKLDLLSREKDAIAPKHDDNDNNETYSPPKLRKRETGDMPQSKSSKEKTNSDVPKLKRGRGRPPKVRPLNEDIPHIVKIKEEPLVVSDKQHIKQKSPKDFAKFAGWSTKSSRHMKPAPRAIMSSKFYKPSAVASSHHRTSLDSLQYKLPADVTQHRSMSTDSDQTSHFPSNYNPARHWKKRKVHEHEIQLSEHTTTPTGFFNTEHITSPTKGLSDFSPEQEPFIVRKNAEQDRKQDSTPKKFDAKNPDSTKMKNLLHSKETFETKLHKTHKNGNSQLPAIGNIQSNPPEQKLSSKQFKMTIKSDAQTKSTSSFTNLKETFPTTHNFLTPPTSQRSESSPSPIRDGNLPSTSTAILTPNINPSLIKDKGIQSSLSNTQTGANVTASPNHSNFKLGFSMQSRDLSNFKIPKKYNPPHTESCSTDR
ncbi:uncharacterized protein LOC120332878 [Styela clava]